MRGNKGTRNFRSNNDNNNTWLDARQELTTLIDHECRISHQKLAKKRPATAATRLNPRLSGRKNDGIPQRRRTSWTESTQYVTDTELSQNKMIMQA